MDVENATSYARMRLAMAFELLGDCKAQERASFANSAELLAEKYGVTEQWRLIASDLTSTGRPVVESKMAAFWAAHRFYAPENDGGMQAAADALAEENARRGAELDEEEFQFRKDWEARS
jgi:hypothetical protein